MMKCDPVTGACLLSDLDEKAAAPLQKIRSDLVVRYIGDPMCSWCWGISPAVREVADFCEAEGIEFSMTMGGLRAGGGDPWSSAFKEFLRNEWQHIAQATGQPFGYTLLDAPNFTYDTEPACRAVVAVQLLQERKKLKSFTALNFFAATQRNFYVDGKDPKVVHFYKGICESLDLDFDEFRGIFESPEARQAVGREFVQCRQWGVRSFPTLLLERNQVRSTLAVGFVKAEKVLSRLRQAVAY
ncbi:putative protein-disulfide isomerase [Variovorax boronicumulans]|uniref:DsbA family protein n=1 Tax=Variovorax boronicumulans TaxID=436515 RepID=UPI0027807D6A|nr:hypothetical protein [Variovorax boronicumulans]MDQ0015385.1 putative protein-disulfide isomerase [Variovorax boronicumulans]